MLIGEYTHALDDKKRVSVPARFRKELGKTVVITHGFDKCLSLYPLRSWTRLAEKLSTLSVGASDARSFNRFILAGAVETEVDSLGRVLIPDFLKEYGGLKSKVVLAGLQDRVELWDEKRWRENKEKVEKQADVLAEKLADVGML